MTLKERIIVETYTGFCMTTGRERDELYKYMGELLGRPFFASDLCKEGVRKLLNEKARPDFQALCVSEEAWAEAEKNVKDLISQYEGLLALYNKGKRTTELYSAMTED